MTRNPETPDTTRLRRYALGALPEHERDELEQQYFADVDALEQLSIVEDELIEDYLEERLDAEARNQFERHYLSTPGHRARVSVMRGLIASARAVQPVAQPAVRSAAQPESESHPPIVTARAARAVARPAALPDSESHPPSTAARAAQHGAAATRWSPFQLAALAASIALLLGLGAVWLFNLPLDDSGRSASTSPAGRPNPPNQSNRPNAPTPSQPSPSSPIASSSSSSSPESSAAAAHSTSPGVPSTTPPSTSPRAPVVVSMSLSAIATRGAGAGPDPAVTIPANADELLLRLETGPDDVPLRRGRAVLRTVEGDELWRGPVETPPESNASVRALVRIPAARLRSGDLIVELHGIDASGRSRESELARYMIRVTLAGRPQSR